MAQVHTKPVLDTKRDTARCIGRQVQGEAPIRHKKMSNVFGSWPGELMWKNNIMIEYKMQPIKQVSVMQSRSGQYIV